MNKLKEARVAAGLTQAGACATCYDIPKRTWEDWESGRRKPAPWAEKLIIEKLSKTKSTP